MDVYNNTTFYISGSVNSEGLTLLEVAVMNHNLELVQLLQRNGATETYNSEFVCCCGVS